MPRQFTTTHLAASAALALVIGGTAGYLLAPDGTEKRVSADSTCPDISTSDSVSDAFSRLVGSGGDVGSTVTEKGQSTDTYHYGCTVQVDGGGRILLTADLVKSGSVSDWKTNLERNGDIGSKNDYKSFALGKTGHGVASSFSAAIYVPCKPVGSKLFVEPNLSVEVTKLDREGDADANRSDAAQVARALAVHAQSGAHCEDAERLPTGPIKWS
ncbi:hypothetical protein ACIPPM_30185 [Streptomyces sp. NPDC090119]|uniref:hypothetical protein n=1 Tax=Streptomyces sp. NPDC090119 TaxID=3365951 RepID=UPI0037FDADD0